ncbi:hypothetical protein [Sphingomonas profundi]|uniref:hypothetical protein n=1 Tax=Alterirhizorhabdus profundi TaxID=2681549 RepID=UPI0012E88352|nr:hypothetical protein [Sphingomonas profundi]
MVDEISNDNDLRRDITTHRPDPHGQAAMLLVESLIHGLIARSVITVQDAVDIIETAAEVKEEIAIELGDSPATMQKSLAILQAILASLSFDLPDGTA